MLMSLKCCYDVLSMIWFDVRQLWSNTFKYLLFELRLKSKTAEECVGLGELKKSSRAFSNLDGTILLKDGSLPLNLRLLEISVLEEPRFESKIRPTCVEDHNLVIMIRIKTKF